MAAVTFSADTDDSGSGTDGTVHNNAWKQAMATAINAAIGDWTARTFSAGNYTASAGNWTVASGDVLRDRYQVINKTLFWNCVIATSTVSATPLTLRIAIPTGSFLSTQGYVKLSYCNDNGTIREGYAAPGDATHLYVYRSDAANWSTATDTTYIYFSGFWELA